MRIFEGNVIVKNFPNFRNRVGEIFEEVKANVPHTVGKNANYIPALEEVDPNLFALSICTVDGQICSFGD